ncbi:aspartic peptidase domain-containing protein [Neurospora crassa]|nr:aspartic peptidase domain-containing protein [Neurospora crassa]
MLFMTSRLVLALGAASVLAADCPSPLSFPITTKQIDPKVPDSLMRGIAVTIGTPEQTILVNAWPDLNNTYIYDQQMLCDPSIIWNDEICFVRRGGIYHEEDSKSFVKYNDFASAGGATNEITTTGTELGVKKLLSSSLAGVEKLSVGGSESSFVTMPIGIPRLRWDGGYTILHALGLGANSTYLNALSQSNKIPSRVWSYFWGRQWGNGAPLDGSIVFGGYDQEKIIGRNYTQSLDYSESTGCWTGMKVTVSDLVLNYRNGDDESIMPRNSAIPVCIVPQRQLLLEAPGFVVDNFEKATGMVKGGESFGLYWGSQVYNNTANPSYYDGDLTIALSNGLSIRIPNSQLLVPSEEIARNGSFITTPDRMELPINRLGTQPATLGRFFFTSAYLMVDHEADTFTLWQANPASKSNLVTINHAKDSCASEPISTDGGASNSTSGSADNAGGGSGSGRDGSGDNSAPVNPNVAAIAGGVAGGVAALALIGAVTFFLVRRQRRANNAQPDKSPGDMTDGPAFYADGHRLAIGELETQYQPSVGELPAPPNYKYPTVGVQQYNPNATQTQQPHYYGVYYNKPAEVEAGWAYEMDGSNRPGPPAELSGGTPRLS